MKLHLYFAALFAVLGIVGNQAFAQTSIYVDQVAGADSKAGTLAAPVQTLSAATAKAIQNSAKGISSNIVVAPGVYRESLNFSGSGSAPITVSAANVGSSTISGSDVFTGWQSLSGGEYVHSFHDTLPTCHIPSAWPHLPAIVLQPEMVFVNGVSLAQIINSGDHRPGTFYVNRGGGQLHIWPPSGTNMGSATVEVSTRSTTLTVNGKSNVTFRGLHLTHAGNCLNTNSANVNSSHNVVLDSMKIDWNNWGGLGINSSSNVTLQNSVLSYNGGVGLNAHQNTGLILKYNETDYNNWRGAQGAFYDFAMGGVKLLLTHTAQVISHYSYRNQAMGMWFDTDNKNITITNSTFSGNLLANLKLEGNQGPVTVTNSSFCSGGHGILLTNTANLTLTGSNFYNNGGDTTWQAQLFLAGNPSGGRPVTDWQTGQHYRVESSNAKVTGNVFASPSSAQHLFATYLGGGDWSAFKNTLHSESNKWNNSATPKTFTVPSGGTTDLNGWRNYTGQDTSSSWSTSSLATRGCGVPSPSYSDFQLQANNRISASVPAWQAPYGMSNHVAKIPLQVQSFNAGTVNLSVSGLPSGASASFSPSSLSNGTTTLSITASSHAPYTTATVTVFGTAGSRVHSVTFPVLIRP